MMSNPQFTFPQTAFHGPSMLSRRRDTISRVTILAQLEQLKDTGRYDCFDLKWQPIYDDKSNWPAPRHLFWDSDLGKWMEGAIYFLSEKYDAEIDAAVRHIVEAIRGAQHEDGYINLHFTVVEPEKRWTNLRDMHELYNAGHLIEAALAHRNCYENNDLLGPLEKYVALIRKTFGPGVDQKRGYPGHPEIELALLRLYRATGNKDAYELARFFLEERGNPKGQQGRHYYDWEAARRGESPWLRPDSYPRKRSHWYNQAHLPILQQPAIEGHAVRAMYLLTAAADLLALDVEGASPRPLEQGAEWAAALRRLWGNMVDCKMYLTGGVGAMEQWEGFGIDYFLPQGSDEGGCYNETCASVGVVMLAERLLYLSCDGGGEPDRRYADVMELCLYNNVMTAMSLGGRAFTYDNQLASSDGHPSTRADWFEVSCCPPNLTRLFGSLGGYLWHYGKATRGGGGEGAFINVHLYTTARVSFEVDGRPVTVEQETDWPWAGTVRFRVDAAPETRLTVRLRIPAWASSFDLAPPPRKKSANDAKLKEGGYLVLRHSYVAANQSFTLTVGGFAPRYLAPHPYTRQHTLSLARGPLVYCAEDVDNPWVMGDHFRNVAVRAGEPVGEMWRLFSLPDDGCREREGNEVIVPEPYVQLETRCWERRSVAGWESSRAGPGSVVFGAWVGAGMETEAERKLVLVPYYFRANRGGNGQMRVGFLRG